PTTSQVINRFLVLNNGMSLVESSWEFGRGINRRRSAATASSDTTVRAAAESEWDEKPIWRRASNAPTNSGSGTTNGAEGNTSGWASGTLLLACPITASGPEASDGRSIFIAAGTAAASSFWTT